MKKNINICIIGLGYVGLPLALAFAEKFKVIGYDTDLNRLKELKLGFDQTLEINKTSLDKVSGNIIYTSNITAISNCNIYIVTVPTPVDKFNKPDLAPLIESSELIGSLLIKNDIVIYESTVYPGVTEEICVPLLEAKSKLVFNVDFFCGYSPERINPGDKNHTLKNTIKVTSGSTKDVAVFVDNLYKEIISAGTHMVSSIKVAEASKVIENTQRDVNIALINEFAIIFNQLDIDTNEVLSAAATKWNFIKLSPGLVGGHCIGIDPYYLTYKAEKIGYKPNLILASRLINDGMGRYIATKTVQEMIKAGKKIKNSKVLVLGFTFKEDSPDFRNTKVIDIISELKDNHINVDIYDPWVEAKDELIDKYNMIGDPMKASKKYDAIVVAVAHSVFKKLTRKEFQKLSNGECPIIDVKNIVDEPTWTL